MAVKMQNVSFGAFDEFIEFLPADELETTLALRSIILDAVPGITEKISYNVPFY